MFKNTTDQIIYLESGTCKPGNSCQVTEKEIKFLIRQRLMAPHKSRPFEPPPERENLSNTFDGESDVHFAGSDISLKEPKPRPWDINKPVPIDSLPIDTPLAPGLDEFGPLKGTKEWDLLGPNVRQGITRKRNHKYGPP